MRTRLIAIVTAIVLAGALSAGAVAIPSWGGEFNNPSPYHVPAASAQNTAPNCPLTAGNGFQCTVSSSSLPPADAHNREMYLNSAYWPAEERPDVEIYAIQQLGYGYRNCAAHLQHYCFLLDAKAVGYPISHRPRVGDLWLATLCAVRFMSGGSFTCTPVSANQWYLGYVEKVYPDGSFTQSWGGSPQPPDSGLGVTRFSGAMDPHTDFIGFMPAGQCPKLVSLRGHTIVFHRRPSC